MSRRKVRASKEAQKMVAELSWAAMVYANAPHTYDGIGFGNEKQEYIERRRLLRKQREQELLAFIAKLESLTPDTQSTDLSENSVRRDAE